ncbi:disease resistance protein RGA2-like isoform X1 [Triticum dicoccoides]|uniref:disease resistance protein RGA2-like isoform X1 n=2 Tax=Triticum dicoccoides TaxID=85692 RepID=UPI001890D964|nr:disease resistance protein RGA2-like isoform X1 [Triticum dicoccoides]XP_037458647.1 disease resistance protein RGA2-like isoform X1 [Triticum dicoccoides]XP_037458648.1 disease resistance protein RGA2-like isoform X1 [Triticum dicoccoides]XP_037458649.1 disease resistance protein RGA2-like isoform X1 [Triticum dicoccoides]XP_037458650.1 disease resistance protein RGA2-like isoform X1 [Triticum dicoccoides]XP_037458651.1 disease resistance protein RGA2-like isoform X1 [Triticum dicoccoides]
MNSEDAGTLTISTSFPSLSTDGHYPLFSPPHSSLGERAPQGRRRRAGSDRFWVSLSTMAESLLLPLVRGVAGKAADALVQTVTRMCGLEDDRETLERHLLAVQCKLANAEERSQSNAYLRSWMEKLKAVAYEADDVLDDFQYEGLRREARIGKSTSRKVLSYVTYHSPLLFRFAMSRKLKSVLEKINKLVEKMNKFGLENSVHQQEPQLPWRQTHSKLDESADIFGRDDDKERAVKLLLDQQDQREVQVLPIFGMGGLGKTTIAKMVYNDQGVQQHFQLKMWRCVSDNFDVVAIVKSIIELATNARCDLPDNIELLQKKLDEVICQKRFLLVLDDVWNEEKTIWEENLKPLLCSIGGPGSVIVVTCRSKQVASIMSTVKPHELAFLDEENSWELFSNKAFSNGVEEEAELVTIGRRIVNKCGGLPLALKTMGGLLSSKRQVHEWKAIEESNIGDTVGGKYEVMPILKLSYKHLSSEMKQCFAFCALFPKDYEMQKDMLIQLWMANGFIQEEGTMDLTQKGEFIFHELVWRSFLQDIKVVVKYTNSFYSSKYETVVCKMHDLMHDLARDVSNECATIEELTELKASVTNVRHMQMSEDVELEKISGLFDGKTSLRTLLAPSKVNRDFNRLQQVSLRALHWQISCANFKAVNGKHLRYLDFSTCSVNATLLDSICLLYNLQTLRLVGCLDLRQLPEDMVISLRKLIHLYLFGCSALERTPPNIGQLNNLHTLTTFVVDTRDGCGIEELKEMRHLSNRLELYSLRKIKSVQHAKEANLQQKQNLTELLFCWGLKRHDKPKNEACNEEEVFQHLEPHSKIKKFELYGYGGPEIPRWMRDPQMFQYLRKLTISNWTRCKNIPVVWLSPSLQYLTLKNMGKLKTLCDNLCIEGGGRSTPLQIFPKLKEMVLKELSSLEGWADNSAGVSIDSSVIFPVLEKLEISQCCKLASFPLSPILKDLTLSGYLDAECVWDFPRLPTSLESLCIHCFGGLVVLPSNLGALAKLSNLVVHNCRRLKGLPDGMDGLTSLRILDITFCPATEEFPNGLLQRLPALDALTIYGCPELQRRCREGGEYFHHLVPIPLKSGFKTRFLEAEAESRIIVPEAETSGKKFLRRLLPSCAHSKSDSESDDN